MGLAGQRVRLLRRGERGRRVAVVGTGGTVLECLRPREVPPASARRVLASLATAPRCVVT